MAVPKRKAEFLGLRNLDVFIEDTAPTSNYFNVLECPEVLTQGKSTFLIGGSNDLKPGIDIKIELIKDGGDTVIYTQPIMGHLEGGLRRVSIEVYDDLEPGIYTLYIVGELNPNTVNVPAEWQGTYNVRWSKKISYNAMGVNTQTILFYKQPGISVSEIQKEYVISPSSSATPVYLTGSGEPAPGFTEPQVPIQTATEGGFSAPTYPDKDFKDKAKLGLIEENKPLVKLSGKKGHIGSKGKQVKTMSPVLDDYLISLSGDSTVSSLYVGEDFTINNPQVDASKFTLQDYHSLPAVYTSSVMKVINNTTFVPKDVFYVNDNRTTPPTLVPAPFEITYPISASYLSLPSQTTSSINFTSFADITVKDMTTFSGDVHKVKIYAKSEGSLGDFELIYDSPIESAQVLYDQQEATNQTNMGYFLDTTRVQKYWEAYDEDEGLTSGTVEYDATYINDAMKISGSNMEYGHSVRVQNKTAVNFLGGILYNFKARVYGIKRDKKDINGNVLNNASMAIMTYGNAFDKEETTAAHWGDERLTMPTIPDGVSEYDFGIVEGSFLANNTDTGYLQFKVDSGEWYVTDIELKTATDTAFNPDYVTVTTPVPPLLERPDRMRFLVEFYDVNNNMADSVVFSEPITFQGPNINISGDNNILSGSMVIGSALGSGIEMAGVNSGYIRSIGYSGFTSASEGTGYPGFLIWSGSVLPDSGDSYGGVGIELVANSESYLRYKSVDGGELDIRADSFYVGSDTTQFISGSDGNVEISSSNFHLTPEGDVTMSGTITAEAGEIGDWVIRDGKLSGSNATLDATGAALHMSDKGPDTDDSAAFDILRDEYYIDFTPADQGNTTNYYVKFGPNFAIDSDGVLIASGAVFEGQITASTGLIGGAEIESASLAYSPYWRISASANTEDSVSFISSSKFKVSADGRITGSQVLFDGGTIAGWNIASQIISSTDSTGGIKFDSYNKQIGIRSGSHVDSTIIEFGRIGGTVADPKFGLEGLDTTGNLLFRLGERGNEIAGWAISGSYISKAISGSAAYQEYTRVYMSSVNDNAKNITEGFSLYRKDEDIDDGAVKIVRLGGLTDTTDLHSNGDYGLQIIKQNTAGSYSNLLYIGSGSQTISGWNISTTGFSNTGVELSSTQASMSLGTSGELLLKGGTNSPYISLQPAEALVDKTYAAAGVFLGVSGGSTPLFSAVGTGGHIKFDGTDLDITADTVHMSGSSITLETPKFFFGGADQYISGSNGNIEISSSAFHLTPEGDVTASNIILGDKSEGDYLQFVDGTLTVQGDVTANEIRTPATIAGSPSTGLNASSSISSTGLARFVSASIGGFEVSTDQINSSNDNIILKDSGQITGSNVLFTGGKIAQWTIDGHLLKSAGVGGVRLNGNEGGAEISVGTHTYGNGPGIQLHYNSGNPQFFAGTSGNYIKYTVAGGVDIQTTKFVLDSDNFDVTEDGDITGSAVLFTGGKIAGWNISGNILQNNDANLRLNGRTSTPKITIGTHTVGNGPGIQLGYDGSGTLTFFAGESATDYLKYTGGTGIDIKTQKLEVDTTNIEISSTNASMSLGEGNILLDGANSKILVGSNSSKQIEIFGNSSKGYIATGKNAVSNYTEGFWIANNNANPEFNIGTATNFIRFQHGDIVMKTYDFFMGATGSAYVSGSNGNLEISSSMFFVSSSGQAILGDASNEHIVVDTNGLTIKDNTTVRGKFIAAGAIIGETSKAHISASTLDVTIKEDDNNYAQVSSSGVSILAGGTKVAGFASTTTLGDTSNEHLQLSSDGVLLKDGSTTRALFTPGGATLGDTSGPHISASTTDVNIIYDANNKAVLDSDSLDFTVGGSEVATFGANPIITGGTVTIRSSANNNDKVVLTADSFKVYDNNVERASFGATTTVGLTGTSAAYSEISSGVFKVRNDSNVFVSASTDGLFTSGSIHAGEGIIGGWSIDKGKIYSSNLNLHSTGIIETADFVSGLKGWRIDSADNGIAEFENAVIRGTLATAVFEKETVNAVGGQLYVANSTMITASAQTSATATTMSVANVGGFTGSYEGNGEIISAKKITDTGFSTEYMLVQSASRNDPSSEKDFSGKLFVVRGYSGSSETDSGSVGDAASIATTYEDGQVIVSTGRIGTGFIRLNANPSDPYTPYIDIVERTGSAIYDVDLKARLGDLSGLSATKLHGTNPASAGFGLYSQNVFLEGGIVANTGSIAGINMESGKLYAGVGTHDNSNTAFYLDSDGQMSLKDKFVWDGSNLSIEGSITITGGSGFASPASVSGSFATPAGVSGSVDTLSGSAASSIGSLTGASASVATQVVLDSAGLALKDTSGNTLADFGATVTVGQDANNKSRIYIDNDSVDLIVDSGGTDSTYASFASTTTVGVTSGDHVSIESTGVSVKDGSTVRGTFTPGGITLGVTSEPHISASLTDIFVKQSDDDYLKIDSDSVDLYAGGTQYATFAATTNIGNTSAEHIVLDTSGLTIKDSSTVRGKFVTGGATIGDTSGRHISASTTELSVIYDANNKAVLDSDSLDFTVGGNEVATFGANPIITGGTVTIRSSANNNDKFVLTADSAKFYDNNNEVASFGATTTVGDTSGEHISIGSSAFEIKTSATNTVLSASSAGMEMSGSIIAGDGQIANFVITPDYMSNDTNANAYSQSMRMDKDSIIFRPGGDASSASPLVQGFAGNYIVSGTHSVGAFNDSVVPYYFDLGAVGVGLFADSGNWAAPHLRVGPYLDQTPTQMSQSIGSDTGMVMEFAPDGQSRTRLYSGKLASSFGATDFANPGMVFENRLDDLVQRRKIRAGENLAHLSRSFTMNIGSDNSYITYTSTGSYYAQYHSDRFIEDGVKIKAPAFHMGDDSKFISGSGGTIGIKSSNFELKTDGSITATGATISGNISITSGDLAGVDAASISGSQNATSASLAGITDGLTEGSESMATQVVLDSAGMTLKNAGGTTLAEYGTTISLRGNGSTHDRLDVSNAAISLYTNNEKKVDINDDGLNIGPAANAGNAVIGNVRLGSSGVYVYGAATNDYVFVKSDGVEVVTAGTDVAEFGAITRIGDASNEHISMSSDGMTIKDGTTTIGSFKGTGATIGDTSGAHVSSSTLDVSIIQDANNKAVVDASGLTVTEGGNQVAQFADTTVIGQSDDKVTINSSGVTIREGGADKIALASGNLTLTGGSVTIRNSTNNNDKVVIAEDSFKVYDNNTEVGSFGSETYIGPTASEHVKISSAGLQLKDGNTTRMSMSSAGIEMGDDFSVDSSGNVSMAGTVSASAGNIAGWTLGSGIFKSANTTGTIDGSTYTTNGMVLLGTGALASKNFYIDTSGNANFKGDLTGASGYFTGDVVATHINTTSGSIGGFTIGTNTLTTSGAGIGKSGQDQAFWAGSDTQNSAEFRVSHAGALVAESVNIAGTISSSAGNIGGWTLGTGLFKSLDTTGTTNGTDFTTTGMVIGGSGYIATPNFLLKADGTARIDGTVSASAGNIAGWTLGSGLIKSLDTTGTTNGTDFTTTGMVLGGSGYIATPNLLLKSDGTARIDGTVSASAGNIGGFTIGANTLITDEAGIGRAGQNQAFWAGSNTPNSAEFRVAHDGTLVASSATITGAITANSGKIGGANGWDITTGEIKRDGVLSIGNGGTIWNGGGDDDYMGIHFGPLSSDITDGSAATGSMWVTRTGFQRTIFRTGNESQFIRFDTADGLEISSSGFHLSQSGDIWANDVNLNNGSFSGTINSSATIQGATLRTALASSTITSHTTNISQIAGTVYLFDGSGAGTPYTSLNQGDFIEITTSSNSNATKTFRVTTTFLNGDKFRATITTGTFNTGNDTAVFSVNPFMMGMEAEGSSYGTDSHRLVVKNGTNETLRIRSNDSDGATRLQVGNMLNSNNKHGYILGATKDVVSTTPTIKGKAHHEAEYVAGGTSVALQGEISWNSEEYGGDFDRWLGTGVAIEALIDTDGVASDGGGADLPKVVDTIIGIRTRKENSTAKKLNSRIDIGILAENKVDGRQYAPNWSGSLIGLQANVENTAEFDGSGETSNAYTTTMVAISASVNSAGAGIESGEEHTFNAYGVKVDINDCDEITGTSYGLYSAHQDATAGGTHYGLYVKDGLSYFGGDVTVAADKKLIFDSSDTYIKANTDDPEDLVIASDQDILIYPGNNILIGDDTFSGPTAKVDINTSSQTSVAQPLLRCKTNGQSGPMVDFVHSEGILDTNDILLNLDYDDDTSIAADNYYIYFQNQDGGVGSINQEIAYNTFTGAHISQRPSGSDFSDWKPGMIVKSTGEIIQMPNSLSGSLSMAWPVVDKTASQKDKAVMGVFTYLSNASVDNPNYSTSSKYCGRMAGMDDNAPSINYNAIGEGKVLVTDTNGNIETGDYICSSTRTGHGEKQDDDIMHNYTVAKATQPYNFTSASNDADLGYKSVLIACTYHCG